MKPVTALFLLSLAAAGGSLTAPAAAAGTAPPETAPAAVAGPAEVKGTLNLNIGRTNEAPGGLNIGASTSGSRSGLIVGPAGPGGNFEDVAGLGIDLEGAPEILPEPEAADGEDEIVRLPGQD